MNNKDEFVCSVKHADQPEVCNYMEWRVLEEG